MNLEHGLSMLVFGGFIAASIKYVYRYQGTPLVGIFLAILFLSLLMLAGVIVDILLQVEVRKSAAEASLLPRNRRIR